MGHTSRFRDAAEVIKYDYRWQALKQVGALDDLVGGHVYLDVPAKIVHSFGEWLNHFDCCGTGLYQIKANTTKAVVGKALELRIGDAGINDGDAPRRGADLPQRVAGAAVVGAVGGRRDNHVARRTNPLLQ